jgi:hypothetical protein
MFQEFFTPSGYDFPRGNRAIVRNVIYHYCLK